MSHKEFVLGSSAVPVFVQEENPLSCHCTISATRHHRTAVTEDEAHECWKQSSWSPSPGPVQCQAHLAGILDRFYSTPTLWVEVGVHRSISHHSHWAQGSWESGCGECWKLWEQGGGGFPLLLMDAPHLQVSVGPGESQQLCSIKVSSG